MKLKPYNEFSPSDEANGVFNKDGNTYYTFDAAKRLFGDKLPTVEQLLEAINSVPGNCEEKAKALNIPFAGYRNADGVFGGADRLAYLWSSSESDGDNAHYVYLSRDFDEARRYWSNRKYAFSVRLLTEDISEIWKDIPGYEGIYQVSNLGKIKKCSTSKYVGSKGRMCGGKSEKIIKTWRTNYEKVKLHKNGNGVNFLIHRLVMLSFNGPSDLQINHKDGNKFNNILENIEYCTASENMKHADRNGLRKMPNGDNHWNYKHGKYSLDKSDSSTLLLFDEVIEKLEETMKEKQDEVDKIGEAIKLIKKLK